MSTAAAPLAARLRDGQRLRLLFVKMPCPAEVEQAATAGFDAVIIDTEHGTPDGLEHHLRAAAAAGIPALVRVPSADPAPILRALDAGATGVVVAHVNDAATARAVISAAHYPPRGRRGLALTTRAGRYGTATLPEYLARAAEETLVVVQIEDAEALAHTDEILTEPGVDAVLIGSADLSISLGHPGAPGHPEVARQIAAIETAARARQVPVATVVGTPAEADAAFARGNRLAVFVATLLVRDAFAAVAGCVASDSEPAVTAPPVLLLPGMLGTAALWDGVTPALAETAAVRFARIDLDTSIAEMAESILAAAPERFALAGHSLGAIVALEVVRRAPERVSRLALLNASALPATPEQLAAWDALEGNARDGDFGELAAAFARANLPQDADATLLARVTAMARDCGPRALLRQLTAQRTRPDARPHLAAIRCPTLIVSGGADAVCPPARQDELTAGIPAARLERIEGVGHMTPLEAPDRVARLLAAWAA